MVLPRPLLRRLRPPVTIPVRSIGTSNLHAPENSSPYSSENPSNRQPPTPSVAPTAPPTPPTIANPILEQYQAAQRAKRAPRTIDTLEAPPQESFLSRRGRLSPNSIFSNTRERRLRPGEKKPSIDGKTAKTPAASSSDTERNTDSLAAVLDPRPDARKRWERKMVIRSVTRRGRLTKAQIIKRTERELTAKSELVRTSMKKMQPLARQIAGKRIEDAITQMRFSRKKAAVAIRAHLQEALDRAIVERGMGLGGRDASSSSSSSAHQTPVAVRDRDGKRRLVKDHTGIYIDQAWVNKGSYGFDALPRARGRVDRLRLPQTSISVLLKEEKTLVREHRERMAKAARKKVWTHLPDRPIPEQRQHYCW